MNWPSENTHTDAHVQDWVRGLLCTQDGTVGDFAEPLEKAEVRAEGRRERKRRHCAFQDAIDPEGYQPPLTHFCVGRGSMETFPSPNGCYFFGNRRWQMHRDHRANLLLFEKELCRTSGKQLWHTVITAGARTTVADAVRQAKTAKEKLKGLNKGTLFNRYGFELIAAFEHTNPLRWPDGTMTLAIHYHCILVKVPGKRTCASNDLHRMLGGRLPGIALELSPVRNLLALLNYSMKEEPGLRQCSPDEVRRMFTAFGKQHAPFARYGSLRDFATELGKSYERAYFNEATGFVDRVPIQFRGPRKKKKKKESVHAPPRVVKICPSKPGPSGLVDIEVVLRGDCSDKERILAENPHLEALVEAGTALYEKGVGEAVHEEAKKLSREGKTVDFAELISRFVDIPQ